MMKTRHAMVACAAVAALGLAGYGLYAIGLQHGMGMATPAAAPVAGAGPQGVAQGEEATRRHITAGLKAGDVDPATGTKILYYHDPMTPATRFDKPAKSPFMDMMLVPVYAGGDADASRVSVSPRIRQNLGVRTAAVTEGTMAPPLAAVGSIAFNERDQVTVQARASGFVERLRVRATLDPVAKGQRLAELYVPEWIAAQEEFLSVRRMRGSDLGALVDAARQRMRQSGMSDVLIAHVERSGRSEARTTLAAPIDGVITELAVREGMTVAAGTTLFRISGLASVWAYAELPESQAGLLRVGMKVQARSPAVPGTVFEGRVQAVLPEVNSTTRTLKVRVELANPKRVLVPGMFMQMQFTGAATMPALQVPSEAIIATGKRTLVMLAESDGRYRPIEVETGIENGGQTEIRRGLAVGQWVVVSAQFLIDSEASLRGVEARLNDTPLPASGSTR